VISFLYLRLLIVTIGYILVKKYFQVGQLQGENSRHDPTRSTCARLRAVCFKKAVHPVLAYFLNLLYCFPSRLYNLSSENLENKTTITSGRPARYRFISMKHFAIILPSCPSSEHGKDKVGKQPGASHG
jgi:hypothetical protein